MKGSKEIINYLYMKGTFIVREINLDDIIITQEVRNYCVDNKCGIYGKNFMCPPFVGTIEDFKKQIKTYKKGYIVVVKDKISNPKVINECYKSAEFLHELMLDVENKARSLGFAKSKSLIGGNCRICKPCAAETGIDSCIYPDKARPSLEAMGIDVINTCRKIGINIKFNRNEVTWVGLLLI